MVAATHDCRPAGTGGAVILDVEGIVAWLDEHDIAFTLHRHPPVFTVDEAAAHAGHLPGAHVKNLFLEDRAGGLWLVTCLDRQPLKVNGLARLLGAPRLAFASPDRLREVLGVAPGSVTPLALVNDRPPRVTPVWDEALLAHELVNVHPLRNDATVAIASADLARVAALTGHAPRLIDPAATLTA